MTSKQRAYLRGLANTIEPIFQIGKTGISDNLIKQLSDALEARELIKITVLETAPDTAKSLSNTIAEQTNSMVVQVIGSKITLFRQKKKDSRYELIK
jgi:RNA-binding protein